MRYGVVSISVTNKKMDGREESKLSLREKVRQGLVIPSLSFPPIKTCNREVVLKKGECGCGGCYALWMRKSARDSWQRNLIAWKNNRDAFKRNLLEFMTEWEPRYFRYFVGGDIPDAEFFELMVSASLVSIFTDSMFFTKQWHFVNDYCKSGELPFNLHPVFSNGVNIKADNPYNFPESTMLFPWEPVEVEKGTICGGNCYECNLTTTGCWFMKKGQTVLLPVHGAGKNKFEKEN